MVEKIALITGATSGFGSFLTSEFARAGYTVVATGRNQERLQKLQEDAAAAGGKCVCVMANLGTADGVMAVVEAIRAHQPQVLVNNAAIHPEMARQQPLTEIQEISNSLLTNTAAAIALSNAAFEHMQAAGGGTIINISSAAGLKGSYDEAVYAASKHGLRGFSESVKDAWLKRGVKVVDVYSGAIATGMSAQRPDVEVLIDPKELASFCVALCATSSFYIRDLSVQRTRQLPL